MKIARMRLRQRDSTTCGPSVAVVAGALLDPAYRARLTDSPSSWFDDEQSRVHAEVNRVWPRMLGTTPMGIARAVTTRTEMRGVRYRWRLFRGRRDRLTDVLDAVSEGWPVAMLVGRFIPRHWVLIVDVDRSPRAGRGLELPLRCYEPTSGEVRPADVAAVRESRLTGLGYPRPFAFVLPSGRPSR
ncbi:hypothetical protein CQY20_23430 [Mycolicibacterium agri]|uniref:Peptidase C39-like domain-containing protein n=1 Tax=Mycolicibacterium agri TaxID=36811 RepID=A0A2A7MTP8_MYCAG|nr:hypothetical protein [Mycolicibacterium agri]PEG34930.1 hypothetical protein CQY20_23430 [Mycolicibacterium agri]GFG53686.1 hypothetical protein MAGR_51270 [Mycolicibacterium agri]